VTHVDDAAIRRYINGNDEPVQKDLRGRAQRVLAGARARCPVDTGRLKSSLKLTHEAGLGGNMQWRVGSDLSYALMVHEGTRPHLIHPRLRRTLRFRDGGRTIYATVVMHPGTRAQPFLTEALWAEGIE
jgi:hypothetical protein